VYCMPLLAGVIKTEKVPPKQKAQNAQKNAQNL